LYLAVTILNSFFSLSLHHLPTYKQFTVQLSALSKNSPLYQYVGNPRGASFASVQQLVTQHANVGVEHYQKNIIAYAIEWEQIVTARVDDGLKKTSVLYQNLNHYQNKINSLRKKVNAVENKGKESPTKLSQKLTRNEAKVKHSWELHEASASALCNLLEEITKGGWKDLYPLVLAALQWEVDRAAGEQDAYGMLSEVAKDMTSTFDEHASVPVVGQVAKDPSGGSSATDSGDSASDSSSDGDGDGDGDGDAYKTAESPELIARMIEI
jgi:hypothetical protein